MARVYSIWNATVSSLQFWILDLKPSSYNDAIADVYMALFYTSTTHTLHQLSDETFFSHFVTTLNSTFGQKFA